MHSKPNIWKKNKNIKTIQFPHILEMVVVGFVVFFFYPFQCILPMTAF